MLVAPVSLGDGSRTGAGAVVTRDVAPGKTVVGMPARPIELRRRTPASAADQRSLHPGGDKNPLDA
jgi:acetyltransferase-like isoleucine patch superfamily enzyme